MSIIKIIKKMYENWNYLRTMPVEEFAKEYDVEVNSSTKLMQQITVMAIPVVFAADILYLLFHFTEIAGWLVIIIIFVNELADKINAAKLPVYGSQGQPIHANQITDLVDQLEKMQGSIQYAEGSITAGIYYLYFRNKGQALSKNVYEAALQNFVKYKFANEIANATISYFKMHVRISQHLGDHELCFIWTFMPNNGSVIQKIIDEDVALNLKNTHDLDE